jgi:hypothetical protein
LWIVCAVDPDAEFFTLIKDGLVNGGIACCGDDKSKPSGVTGCVFTMDEGDGDVVELFDDLGGENRDVSTSGKKLLHFAKCNASTTDDEDWASDQVEIHWKLHRN